MSDFELIVNLFENHLNTISLMLGAIGGIFALAGIFSYFQVKKYIVSTINEAVKEKVNLEFSEFNVKNIIEKKLNEKIENYDVIIRDVTKIEQQEKIL
jgi:hypothetical protein